ncbi:hypothetical protein ABPG72_019401 [Tetrahymena utriculariae]
MLSNIIRFRFSINDRLKKFKPPTRVEKQVPKYYPIQHPRKIDSHDSSIITHDKPIHYVTPRYEVPIEVYRDPNAGLAEIEQPLNPKTLDVALLGPPNAGKSSLMNYIVKSQISAVSNKANTTYESILGVHTNLEKQTQILFYDTPGITKQYKYSKAYVTRAWDILNDVNKAVFMIDGVKTLDDKIREALKRLNNLKYNEKANKKIDQITQLNSEDPVYKEKLKHILSNDHNKADITDDSYGSSSFPKVLVVNKMDLCTNKKKLNWIVSEIEDLSKFDHKFFISCETGYGIPQLLEYLESEAIPSQWKRHSKIKTDLSKVDIIEQIVKSAIFSRYFEEIPYQTGVSLKEFSQRNDGLIKLHFELDVQTEHQKKILTGYKGRNVLELISQIKIELIKLFQKDFEITVKIKVRKNTLEEENFKVEEITSDNYGEVVAEKLLKQNKEERKQIIQQLEHFLTYPLLK